MKKIKTIAFVLLAIFFLESFTPTQTVPSPQSLMVTLSGFRDDNKNLKCRLYYMSTLPSEYSDIKKVRIKLFKPLTDGNFEELSNIVVPLDWDAAAQTEGVISFYTAKNILYIGIGDYDLMRKYKCSLSFINEKGEESKPAVYSKL